MKTLTLNTIEKIVLILISLLAICSSLFSQAKKQYISTSNVTKQIQSSINLNELSKLKNQFELDREKQILNRSKLNIAPQIILEDSTIAYFDRIDTMGNPTYLTTYNYAGSTVTNVHKLLNLPANIAPVGTGITVAVWDESGVRTTHREFGNRVTIKDGAAQTSNHSAHVAGSIGAVGINLSARGMATNVNISSYDFYSAFAEMTTEAGQGLLISNHSYGTAVNNSNLYAFGKYDYYSNSFDNIAYNAPYYTMVKAAGNTRDKGFNIVDGGYDQLADGANAKNILVVGAVRIDYNNVTPEATFMSNYSSFGPTDDYRIKPDLVAPGSNIYSTVATNDSAYGFNTGTSMATPIVSGAIADLQQFYISKYSQPMKSATVRALLTGTALDKGNPGPDFAFGWGLLDAKKAYDVINTNNKFSKIIEDTLNNNSTDTFIIKSDGLLPLQVNLAWTDPAAKVDYANYYTEDLYQITLVNNLDIRIYRDTNTYKPFAMNPASGFTQIATNSDNNADNIECIKINNTAYGNYIVVVSHKGSLTNNSQAYSLVIQGLENSNCLSPKDFNIDTNAVNKLVLKWTNVQTNAQSKLRYKKTTDANWTYSNLTPNSNSVTLSALEYNNNYNLSLITYTSNGLDSSNSFFTTLGTPVKPCSAIQYVNLDSISHDHTKITWGSVINDPSTEYTVRYKTSYDASWTYYTGTIFDTVIELNNLLPSMQYTFNVKESCANDADFFQTIFMTKSSSVLSLQNISITGRNNGAYNIITWNPNMPDISQAEILKYKNNQYESIGSVDFATGKFIDTNIIGESIYKLKVTIQGNVYYSNQINIIKSNNNMYHVYYNPSSQSIHIENFDTDNSQNTELVLFDINGRMLKHQSLQNQGHQELSTSNLVDGLYIINILKDNHPLQTIKLIKD